MRIMTLGVLALLAAGASAQIPNPSQGNGGVLFAAWDDERSYTYYVGIDFLTLQPGLAAQSFALPMIEGYFIDPDAVSWTVTAADGDGDVLFGGAAFYATGQVTNITSGAGVLAATGAIDNFITAVNNACPGSDVCFALAGDLHYAGGEAFGGDLGFSGGLSLADPLGVANSFSLTEQVAFDPDGQATNRAAPYFWGFDGQSLTYGETVCVEFDGFDDSITVEVAGRRQRLASWVNWDGAGAVAMMSGVDRGEESTLLCSDDATCPLGPETPLNWRFTINDTLGRFTLQLLRSNGNVITVRDNQPYTLRPGACAPPMVPKGQTSIDLGVVYGY